METYSFGSRQLNKHIGLLQSDGVIARVNGFVGMRELRLCFATMRYGQEADIAQIANTSTTEVGMSEAYQNRIADMVA